MATSSGYDYEVFLSFRGPDTRERFTDFLYTSLKDAGIRTFKDNEDLRKGEEFGPELLQAINYSKISIPILSKGYASSIWCLKELVQMIECQKTKGQKIMPIFYDVAPSEVRYQTEEYGYAFLSHEKNQRYDEETMHQWKAALKEVSFLNGWDLYSKTYRREGEFAKMVTQEVFNKLKKAYLEVSDCLVSVNHHVDEIMKKIGAQTRETRIIVIHGMGGVGKSTIAKIIYNQLSNNFKHCCFMSNIREMSESKGIEWLQHQLISNILKMKQIYTKDRDEGTQIVKNRLSTKQVLLLLDDVHEKKHMDALVGKCNWFGKGSKIIITTRNKDILKVPVVDDHYEVSMMDSVQSLQLFSKHAFRRDSPLDDYITQSNRAIDIARGLPLALEVIGSLLSRTKKEMWDVTLDKLTDVPHVDVQSKLKISFDALEVRQQHIFLDIACLFIGYDKDNAVHFWEKSKFFPEEAMEVLQNVSLIKIREDNKVWMHDQLRDLGREMVRQQSKMKIEKQSRVWNPDEALDLLRRHKEVKLHMIGKGGATWSCHLLVRTPTFSSANIERLILQDCKSLIKIDRSICQLKCLTYLDASSCEKLCWLPEELGRHLASLEYLSLEGCKSLERLPDSIWNLKLLSKLNINWTRIEELPKSIENLRNLKVVKICSSHISKIPSALWTIKNLEEIDYNCDNLPGGHVKVGNCISRNQSLRILKLKFTNIYALPRLPESLITLELSWLYMDTFPDLSNLTNLKVLNLIFGPPDFDVISNGPEGCPIPRWIGNLTKLEILHLHSFYMTTSPTDLSLPPQLKSLCLECSNLCQLPRLPSSLSSLRLSGCDSLCSMEDLSNLKNLSSLQIDRAAITEIQGLGCLENLRELQLNWLGRVKILPDLSNLNKLRSLQVECCRNLIEIQGELPQFLDRLKICSCFLLQKLPDLSSFMGNTDLEIDDCDKFLEYARMDREVLVLEGFKQLQILHDLSKSNKLRRLQVENCCNLVEIQGELPQSLEKLKISFCESLQKLPNLYSLKGLQHIDLEGCTKLRVETILGSTQRSQANLWENLRYLRICSLGQEEILPDLSNLNKLWRIQVEDCGNLVEIQGKLPKSLTELEICSCKSLRKLPDLSSLNKLRRVKIHGCGKLNAEAISRLCSEKSIMFVEEDI